MRRRCIYRVHCDIQVALSSVASAFRCTTIVLKAKSNFTKLLSNKKRNVRCEIENEIVRQMGRLCQKFVLQIENRYWLIRYWSSQSYVDVVVRPTNKHDNKQTKQILILSKLPTRRMRQRRIFLHCEIQASLFSVRVCWTTFTSEMNNSRNY